MRVEFVSYKPSGQLLKLILSLLLAIWLIPVNAMTIGQPEEAYAATTATLPSDDETLKYNGHTYWVNTEKTIASFEEAEEYCEKLGGHLATLTTAAENNAVYNYISGKGVTTAYFGYTDKQSEGTWNWITGETSSFSNWHSGEPTNNYELENYAQFYFYFEDSTWNDADWGIKTWHDETNFIVEWDYLVSEQIDFDYGRDGTSFNHTSNSFVGGYQITNYETYEKLASLFTIPNINNRSLAVLKLKNIMFPSEGWDGSCHGIASTVGFVFEGYIDASELSDKGEEVGCYHDISAPSGAGFTWDGRFQSAISFYQLLQFTDEYGSQYFDTRKQALEALISNLNTEGAQLFGYHYYYNNEPVGHTVYIPTQKIEEGDGYYEIKYYDCNYEHAGQYESMELGTMQVGTGYDWISFYDAEGRYFHWAENEKSLDIYTEIQCIDTISLKDFYTPFDSTSYSLQSLSDSNETNTDIVEIEFPVNCAFEIVNNDGQKLNCTNGEFNGDWQVQEKHLSCNENPLYTIVLSAGGPYNITFLSDSCNISIYDPDGGVNISGTGIQTATFTPGETTKLNGGSYDYSVMSSVKEADEHNGEGVVQVSAHATDEVVATVESETVKVDSESEMTNLNISSYLEADEYEKTTIASTKSAEGEAYFKRAQLEAGEAAGYMESLCADEGGSVVLPEPTGFSYDGHVFTGWKLESTGAIYQPSDTIELKEDMTLTALWRESPRLLGDVNCDDGLSVIDAVMLQRHLACIEGARLEGEPLARADVDGDSEVTMRDLVALVRLLLER